MNTTSKVAIYEDDTRAWHLIEADSLLALAKLPDACVDAVVADPPYALGIVGEAWDRPGIRRAAGNQSRILQLQKDLGQKYVWKTENFVMAYLLV